MAYTVAETLNIPHPFDKERKLAGNDWLANFLARSNTLSMRKPEATSIQRIEGFNKDAVEQFFNVLSDCFKKHNYSAQQVYNIDETGFNVVHKVRKIIAEKGKKQVGRAVSGERGKNITVCCAFNAAGSYVPPFFISYHKSMQTKFMRKRFPGSVGVSNGTGWMDCDTFLKYMDHFIENEKPSETNPLLVILDGHVSHRSLEVILKCRENHITLVTLPPHTSHRTQPLDRTFFYPLNTAYNNECDTFTAKNPGQKIDVFDIVGLISKAFEKKAVPRYGIKYVFFCINFVMSR